MFLKDQTGVREITGFSQAPSIESIYLDLQDRSSSSPELGVYCNKDIKIDPSKKLAIILTGFTCAGKDTVMDQLEASGDFYHVVTATSRERRDGEPEDKYVWLTVREREKGESIQAYKESLMKEHELVECDIHYGRVYGLPLSSLLREASGVPVIRPDINGARTLHENLPEFGFQPVSIALMPDSWEQVYEVLLNEREGSIKEKNSRILEDVENIDLYKDIVNYFLHNSRNEYEGMSGLQRAVRGVRYILKNREVS